MSNLTDMRKKRAHRIRNFRKWHKRIGLGLLAFFFIMALTGVLLAWKDPLGLKPSAEKTSEPTSVEKWSSLHQIVQVAQAHALAKGLDTQIDRVDIRPDKGVAKVLFKRHFTELQIEGLSGEIVSEEVRADHFIERIHDGSIIEFYFYQTDVSKWVYSTLIGLGLIALSLSGFFLWYGPKKMT
jgi:uncharacterized iron-regulated membrane protein